MSLRCNSLSLCVDEVGFGDVKPSPGLKRGLFQGYSYKVQETGVWKSSTPCLLDTFYSGIPHIAPQPYGNTDRVQTQWGVDVPLLPCVEHCHHHALHSYRTHYHHRQLGPTAVSHLWCLFPTRTDLTWYMIVERLPQTTTAVTQMRK
jgi:hypothetical protein